MSFQASPSISGSPPLKKRNIDLSQHTKTLFLEGSLSDVTIKAFGRTWNLHKFILFSSPYFKSLFTKDWKDSKERVLQLRIPDQTVTVEALHACLQSMYAFEMKFTKANVVPMLAAASFLQLNDQIQSCYEFMIETMQMDSVVDYLNSVSIYGGGKAVEKAAFECLENSLTMIKFEGELSKIDPELMTKVAASCNLCCNNEVSLYVTMVLWLYMKVTGLTFEENDSNARIKRAYDYFENLEGSIPFLSRAAGRSYLNAFRQIRIRDLLITRTATLSSLKRRKIFPKEWIEKALAENWERIEQAMSNTNSPNQDEKYFHENFVRCGVSYLTFQPFSTFFIHALIGLEFIAKNSGNKWIFKIRRTKGKIDPIPPDEKKEIFVRGRVVKKDQNGKILFILSGSIKKTALKVGEEFDVLQIEEELNNFWINASLEYLL